MTPWTGAGQVPLSMGFSRQEYWSGLPFPSLGDLPDPGSKPRSPALQVNSLLSETSGKPFISWLSSDEGKPIWRVNQIPVQSSSWHLSSGWVFNSQELKYGHFGPCRYFNILLDNEKNSQSTNRVIRNNNLLFLLALKFGLIFTWIDHWNSRWMVPL